MVNSRQKGKRGELAFRDLLRERGYADARRGQQFAGGPDSPDVVGGPKGFHFEVKFRETHQPWEAMAQAEAERRPHDVPVVAMKKNGKQWLIVLRERDFFHLLRCAENGERAIDLLLDAPLTTKAESIR